MADLIDRQAVQEMVDRIGGMYPYRQIGNRDSYSQYNEAWTDAINRVDAELNSLPSAQSERPFEIQDILDYLDTVLHPIISPEHWNVYSELHDMIAMLPSAYPETDGFCTDCKEYDSERHFCPRFDRVIKKTVEEMKAEQQWIPFKTRPLTEEEKEDHPELDCILDCKLPDDGQRILVSINLRGHEEVQQDEFYTDDGSYLDSGYEIGTEATAWMPLPESYSGE